MSFDNKRYGDLTKRVLKLDGLRTKYTKPLEERAELCGLLGLNSLDGLDGEDITDLLQAKSQTETLKLYSDTYDNLETILGEVGEFDNLFGVLVGMPYEFGYGEIAKDHKDLRETLEKVEIAKKDPSALSELVVELGNRYKDLAPAFAKIARRNPTGLLNLYANHVIPAKKEKLKGNFMVNEGEYDENQAFNYISYILANVSEKQMLEAVLPIALAAKESYK